MLVARRCAHERARPPTNQRVLRVTGLMAGTSHGSCPEVAGAAAEREVRVLRDFSLPNLNEA